MDNSQLHGNVIGLREEGKILNEYEPATSPHHIDLIHSDPVLRYDGSDIGLIGCATG